MSSPSLFPLPPSRGEHQEKWDEERPGVASAWVFCSVPQQAWENAGEPGRLPREQVGVEAREAQEPSLDRTQGARGKVKDSGHHRSKSSSTENTQLRRASEKNPSTRESRENLEGSDSCLSPFFIRSASVASLESRVALSYGGGESG